MLILLYAIWRLRKYQGMCYTVDQDNLQTNFNMLSRADMLKIQRQLHFG